MDLLIISSYFPPRAPTAATRIGKLARHFLIKGHDVRVITAHNPDFPAILPLEIDAKHVTYTKLPAINALPGRIKALFRFRRQGDVAAPAETAATGEGAATSAGLATHLRELFETLTNIPDNYVGWYRPAVRAGEREIRRRRPDLIYASVPLHTGVLVAARLGRRHGIPVVVEYRDLWVEHPYYDQPAWRRVVERLLERRAARAVAGYVTVTKGWAELLKSRRGKPTALVFNGFDPADFSGPDNAPPEPPSDKLTLVYAGALYGDKRDPRPLFEALCRLGGEAEAIRVLFYTPDAGTLSRRIADYGLDEIVEAREPIPQTRILALEQAVDVLLLLRWDHPSEAAVVAGKLFEYIGAGRPILSVGMETGEAADIIRENEFGTVSKDPDGIAQQLRTWLAEKRARGTLAGTDPDRRQAFSRDKQFAHLEAFLTGLAAGD